MGCASIPLRGIRIAPASIFIIGGGHNSPLPMKAQFNYTAYQSWQGKCYALFLKLKAIKTNGIYYNFSYESLSRTIGISQSSLRKYLPILFEKGLVRLEHGHLHVVSYETFHKSLIGYCYKRNRRIRIHLSDTLIQIVNKLERAALHTIQSQQQWCYEAKVDANYSKTLKQMKSGRKRLRRIQNVQCKKAFPETIISVRSFAAKIGKSTTSVWRFLNKLKAEGVLEIEPLREIVRYRVGNIPSYQWLFPNDGYYFIHNGCLYRHRGSRIVYKEKGVVAV